MRRRQLVTSRERLRYLSCPLLQVRKGALVTQSEKLQQKIKQQEAEPQGCQCIIQ